MDSVPSVTLEGFGETEAGHGRRWRWALGNSSSIHFPLGAYRSRIYYRLMIPAPSQELMIQVNEKLVRTLAADVPEKYFEGHFDFSPCPGAGQTIRFTMSRPENAGHPTDPGLSFLVNRFILTVLPVFPPPAR